MEHNMLIRDLKGLANISPDCIKVAMSTAEIKYVVECCEYYERWRQINRDVKTIGGKEKV